MTSAMLRWKRPFFLVQRRLAATCVVASVSIASCTKPAGPSPTTPLNIEAANANDNAAPGGAAAPSRAEEAADAHVPAPDVRGAAFVRETTVLRREASEARFIENKGKKRQANFITSLQRGEAVEVLEARPPFLRVQLSDETTGWAKAAGIRVGATLRAATTLTRLHCFLRPDLLAMESARQVEPGSILFVLREKDSFAEVDAGPLTTYWVLTDALVHDGQEIEAAKLFGRARALAQSDADKAKPLFDLLRTRFQTTQLVQKLLGEAHLEAGAESGSPNQATVPSNDVAPGAPAAPAPTDDANERMPASEMESLRSPLAPPPDDPPAASP